MLCIALDRQKCKLSDVFRKAKGEEMCIRFLYIIFFALKRERQAQGSLNAPLSEMLLNECRN